MVTVKYCSSLIMKLLFVNSIGRLKKSHVLQMIRLWLVNSVGRKKKSRTFCKEYEKSSRCCGRIFSLRRNVVSEVSKMVDFWCLDRALKCQTRVQVKETCLLEHEDVA